MSGILRTESYITTDPVPYIRILDGLMGPYDEAGEVIDILKNVVFWPRNWVISPYFHISALVCERRKQRC